MALAADLRRIRVTTGRFEIRSFRAKVRRIYQRNFDSKTVIEPAKLGKILGLGLCYKTNAVLMHYLQSS